WAVRTELGQTNWQSDSEQVLEFDSRRAGIAELPPRPPVESIPDEPGPARGSRHGRARLTEDPVREMRALHAEGIVITELAARFDVGRVTVHYVVSRRTWTHI